MGGGAILTTTVVYFIPDTNFYIPYRGTNNKKDEEKITFL
jgi:hypothetical protein